MTNHTPGPWRVDPEKDYCVIAGPNGMDIAQVATQGMGHHVKPNSMLVAAAPDLLAALEELTIPGLSHVPHEWRAALERARAAIAKAKGEV